MNHLTNFNTRLTFSDKKHFNALLPDLKLLPCYSNANFKARKLYFGNLFSGPQSDLCSGGTLFANGFSYFSVKDSIGTACLVNSSSVLSVNGSYKAAFVFFNRGKSSNSDIWGFVKSNIYTVKLKKEKIEQLRNFSIRSYRHKLVEHLSAPFTRQDKVLNNRLTFFSPDYSINIFASNFCNMRNNGKNFLISGLFLTPSYNFYKIYSVFSPSFSDLTVSCGREVNNGLIINSNFLDISNRENFTCAKIAVKDFFGFSQLNSLRFFNTHAFRNFFFNNRNFSRYLLNLKKSLPLSRPLMSVRFNLINFISRNAFLKYDSRSPATINRKWVRDHYEILYNDFMKISPTVSKLIARSSHFININKKLNLKNKSPVFASLSKSVFNQKISYSALLPYFINVSKMYNCYSFENFFIRDLQYKKYRSVSYRRSRLSKYYKSLWCLPDTKSMKTRRK